MLQKETVLAVKNLSVLYNPNVKAVNDLSFDIKKAGILAITGESGSGKSSTAFAIPRLLSDCVIQGEIVFNSNIFGQLDLLECSSEQLSDILGNEISVIFQEPLSSFNPVIKCGDQILETVIKHQNLEKKQAKKQVFETLKLCQLKGEEKIYNSYPHELSGGQLQRVAIAMAIINKPSLLIADEMTSNLDSFSRDEIIDLLLKINSELALSILFVSHEMTLFENFCDEILIMKGGRKIESGSTKQIFKNPKNDYTKSLIANMNYDLKSTSFKAQETVLSLNNLNIDYRQGNSFLFKNHENFTAVDNISFDLKKGEILGLIGKSGSGKTSIGKAIVQLIDNYEGSIEFQGLVLNKMSRAQLRKMRKSIQLIFQDPSSSLDPRLSIGFSLKEPILSHNLLEKGEALNDKIDHLLNLVDLDPSFRNRLPDELSGGEKQRVCIARALSLNPEVLICDEAVSSLDANIKKGILKLLADLRDKRELSILFISHDLDLVNHFCDRIISIAEGKIISESENA